MQPHKLAPLILLLALFPATAVAITPTTPANNTTITTTHPTFSWTVNGDHASTIDISRSARVTPSGEFFDEDRETSGGAGDGLLSWQPTGAIPAGTYYWSIAWYTDDYSTSGHTTPMAFTIRPSITRPRVALTQYANIADAYATIRWRSNVRSTRTVCVVRAGRKRVSRSVVASRYPTVGGSNSDQCALRIPERFDGRRLSLVVTVAGGGVTKTRSIGFRAK